MFTPRFKLSTQKQQELAHAYDANLRENLPKLIKVLALEKAIIVEKTTHLNPIDSCIAALTQLTLLWNKCLEQSNLTEENSINILNTQPALHKELRTVGYWLQAASRWCVVAEITDKIDSKVVPDYFMNLAKFKPINGKPLAKLKSNTPEDPTNYACLYTLANIEDVMMTTKRDFGITRYGTYLHVPAKTFFSAQTLVKTQTNVTPNTKNTPNASTATTSQTSLKTLSDTKAPVFSEKTAHACFEVIRKQIETIISQVPDSKEMNDLNTKILLLKQLSEKGQSWVESYNTAVKYIRQYWDSEKDRYKYKNEKKLIALLNRYPDDVSELKTLRTIGALLKSLSEIVLKDKLSPISQLIVNDSNVFRLPVANDATKQMKK